MDSLDRDRKVPFLAQCSRDTRTLHQLYLYGGGTAANGTPQTCTDQLLAEGGGSTSTLLMRRKMLLTDSGKHLHLLLPAAAGAEAPAQQNLMQSASAAYDSAIFRVQRKQMHQQQIDLEDSKPPSMCLQGAPAAGQEVFAWTIHLVHTANFSIPP